MKNKNRQQRRRDKPAAPVSITCFLSVVKDQGAIGYGLAVVRGRQLLKIDQGAAKGVGVKLATIEILSAAMKHVPTGTDVTIYTSDFVLKDTINEVRLKTKEIDPKTAHYSDLLMLKAQLLPYKIRAPISTGATMSETKENGRLSFSLAKDAVKKALTSR